MQRLTLWSRIHYSRALVLAQPAFRVCHFQMWLQVMLWLRPKLATRCAVQVLLGGALPQAKFGCSLYPARGHLAQVT